jgi:hypothetical protein
MVGQELASQALALEASMVGGDEGNAAAETGLAGQMCGHVATVQDIVIE